MHGLYNQKGFKNFDHPNQKSSNRISFPNKVRESEENLNKMKSKLFKQLQYKLRLAVEKGDIKTLKKLLSEIGTPINYSLAEGSSRSNQIQIYLNSQGQDQWTLLHIATNEGNYSAVKFLLENGANPNTQSVNQRTALHLA
jgi:ankyrin repeat protein